MPTARGGKLPSEVTQSDIEKYSSPAVVESYKRGVSSGRTSGLTQAQIQQAQEATARDKAAKELAIKQEAQRKQVTIEAVATEERKQAYFRRLDEIRESKGLPPTGLVKNKIPPTQFIEGGILPDITERGASTLGRREIYDKPIGSFVSVGGEGTKQTTGQPTSAVITSSGGLSVATGTGSARQISDVMARDEKIDRAADIGTQFLPTTLGGILDKPLSIEIQKKVTDKPISIISPSTTITVLKEERQAKEDAARIRALNVNIERLSKQYEMGEITYEFYSSAYQGYIDRNKDIIDRSKRQEYAATTRQLIADSDIGPIGRGAFNVAASAIQIVPMLDPTTRIALGASQSLGGIRKVGKDEAGGVTDILAGSLIAGTGFAKPGFNVAATAPSRISTAAKVVTGTGIVGGLGYLEGKRVYESTGDIASSIGAGIGTSAGIVGLGIYESKRLNPYKKDLQKLKADKPIGEAGYFQTKDGKLQYISTSTRKGDKLFSQTTLRFDVTQQGDDLILIGKGKGTVTFSDLKSGKTLYSKDIGFGGTAQTGGKAIRVDITKVKSININGKNIKVDTKFIQDKPLDAIVGRGRVTLDFGDDVISKKFSTLSFDEGKYTLSAADDLLRGYVRPTGDKIKLKDYKVAGGEISLDKLTSPKTKFSPKSFTRAGQLTKPQLNIMTGKDGADLGLLTRRGVSGYVPSSKTYSIADDVTRFVTTPITSKLSPITPIKPSTGGLVFKSVKVTAPKINLAAPTGFAAGAESAISSSLRILPRTPIIAPVSAFGQKTILLPETEKITGKAQEIESLTDLSLDKEIGKETTTITTTKTVRKSSTSSRTDIGRIQKPIQLPAVEPIQERPKESQRIFRQVPVLSITFTGLTTKLPPKEIIPGFLLPKPIQETRRSGIYGVQIRRFGEFRNIGTFTTVEKALARGKEVTGGTLAATFRVTGATALPKAIKGYRTKKTDKGIEFIEKKELRLSKLSEVGEIKLYPKKRKKKKVNKK